MSSSTSGLRNRRSFGAIDKRIQEKEAALKKQQSSSSSPSSSSEHESLLSLLQPASVEMLQKFPEIKRSRLLQQLSKALLMVRASTVAAKDASDVTVRRVDGCSAAPSPNDFQQRILRDFEARLGVELEALRRAKALGEQLRNEDRYARRVALMLTLLVIAVTIGIALYLSDERRFYLFHQALAKWYYYLFVRQGGSGGQTGKEGLFLDESEGKTYDLYE